MASAGDALHAALWGYVADLTETVKVPEVREATYEDVSRIYGTGSSARKAMADALGLPTGREGSPERRARQSFLEAARRWERGSVRNPNLERGYWRRLVNAARQEGRRRRRASRKTQLDTLSSMVADAGLLFRSFDGVLRVSEDDRARAIDVSDNDDDDEHPGGIWLDPGELEAGYGPRGENFYQAIEADDWETAATCVISVFMDRYTDGATGGYVTFADEVDLLEVEIP